ncbi:MAG: U32 family peptidase [Erysipelotrichaceae bacterium]|nr:U32 family peptidase [Erysipelotrichaceae bacterium]
MEKVELLAPAGDLEKLKIAILFGANAVFCGGKQFSLRAKANNFSLVDLKEAVTFANKHNAKVHVTVNIVPVDDDFATLDEYLLALDQIGVHAIIVSSIYIMKRAKELNCHFEVHVSTQHSIANSKAIEFFKDVADRVVLARELSIDDIKDVKNKSVLPIETFIHGGMCSSYSGRCTLSNAMVNRDANKGGCAHSCRWTYHLYLKDTLVSNDNFIIASCDLMSIKYIPSLLSLNIDSFKIEGRMKSVHYIATVVNAYRKIIDAVYDNKNNDKIDIKPYINQIKKAENRITYTGFLSKKLKNEALLLNTSKENPTQSFIAIVLSQKDENGYNLIEVRNNFKNKIKANYLSANGNSGNVKILQLKDLDFNEVDIARHPKQILLAKLDVDLPVFTLIRKK